MICRYILGLIYVLICFGGQINIKDFLFSQVMVKGTGVQVQEKNILNKLIINARLGTWNENFQAPSARIMATEALLPTHEFPPPSPYVCADEYHAYHAIDHIAIITIFWFVCVGLIRLCFGREQYDIGNDEKNNHEDDADTKTNDGLSNLHSKEVKKGPSTHTRLSSLDAVRGLNMAIMVLVDETGSAYPHITHSPWNNITFADLVMPWSVCPTWISTRPKYQHSLSFICRISHACGCNWGAIAL